VRGRGAGEPDPDPDEGIGERDLPIRGVVSPERQHRGEGEHEEHVAAQQREPGAAGLDQLGRARCDQDHEHDGGQERGARLQGGVAEHVLQVLLADEHRPHQRAEDDDAGAAGDPEDAPTGDVQVVQGIRSSALAEDERRRGHQRDACETECERALVRHWREVDREDQRADQDD
jgi:hypothetical protein